LQKEKIQKQIKTRVEKNKKMLGAFGSKAPLKLLQSQGGWYAVVRLPDECSEENWVLDLLEKEHVFVHPGYFFDLHEGTHIVLSYLTSEDIFKQGLERIIKHSAGSSRI
jgi:aspartate/methionine/tyrosine aminotransferase